MAFCAWKARIAAATCRFIRLFQLQHHDAALTTAESYSDVLFSDAGDIFLPPFSTRHFYETMKRPHTLRSAIIAILFSR